MIDRVDLSLGQKPAEIDWEGYFNRIIDYLNAGIPVSDIALTGGKLDVSITGDSATVGGKSADEIIAGDFPEVKKTLIDLISGGADLVLKGGVATKNATIATQLDITACSVVQKISSTGIIDRVDLTAKSKTTVQANTTYYLDVEAGSNDFTWGTSHPTGDYVAICTVITDLNAQITTIIDNRPLKFTLFNGFDCSLDLGTITEDLDAAEADIDTLQTDLATLSGNHNTLNTTVTNLSTTVTNHINNTDAHTKVFRIGHTYAIPGEIKVPSGDTNFIIPFFVSLASGQSAKLSKVRYKINSGTSVTCKLQRNGSDVTGFTGISATTTAAETDPTDVALADNDMLALIVTAVSGTPKNLTFTLFIDYEQ